MLDAVPPIGLRHSHSLIVEWAVTVTGLPPVVGNTSHMPPVFGTPYMIALVEVACSEAVTPYLGPQLRTVGTHVDMSHVAATPIGARVTAEVELVAIEGRKLRFKAECRDETGVIGAGFHERTIVDMAKFLARLAAKPAVSQ